MYCDIHVDDDDAIIAVPMMPTMWEIDGAACPICGQEKCLVEVSRAEDTAGRDLVLVLTCESCERAIVLVRLVLALGIQRGVPLLRGGPTK
jgi:hypothetical protein